MLLIALGNQALVILGKTTKAIDIDQWYVYVSYVFTAVSAVTGWWKNNSFTNKAQEGDAVMNDDGVNEILIESEMGNNE